MIWLRRRFRCDECGSRHLEDRPEFEGKMTRRLARQIVADARQLSVTEITHRYGFTWSTIMALVKTWSERVAEHRRKQRYRVLLIDETSLRRRHRYVTVLVNADTGEALGVVEHLSAKALASLPAKATAGSEVSRSSSPTALMLTAPQSKRTTRTPPTSSIASTV